MFRIASILFIAACLCWIVTSCTTSQLTTALKAIDDANRVGTIIEHVADSPASDLLPPGLGTGIGLVVTSILGTLVTIKKLLPLLARKPPTTDSTKAA